MATPTKLNPGKRKKLLEAIVECGGNISAACRACGGDITAPYVSSLKRKDDKFGEMLREAQERGAEMLESEAIRRAFEGVEEPVYQGGELVGHKQKYSDTLTIFLLKGQMREKYGDTSKVQLSGGGSAIKIAWEEDFEDEDFMK